FLLVVAQHVYPEPRGACPRRKAALFSPLPDASCGLPGCPLPTRAFSACSFICWAVTAALILVPHRGNQQAKGNAPHHPAFSPLTGTASFRGFSFTPFAACSLRRNFFGSFPSPQILNEPKSLYQGPSGASGSDSRHSFN